ncbi:O-antigen polysaccharide polymerase Wzy [Aeromonas caviae]
MNVNKRTINLIFSITLMLCAIIYSVYPGLDDDYILIAVISLLIYSGCLFSSIVFFGHLQVINIFLYTVGIFIYGRVISYVIDKYYNYYDVTMFVSTIIKPVEAKALLSMSSMVLSGVYFGYSFCSSVFERKNIKQQLKSKIKIPAKTISFIILCMMLPYILTGVISTINGGYLSFYMENIRLQESGSIIPSLYSFAITLTVIFLSFSIHSEDNNRINVYLFLLFINALLLTIVGQRGPIISFVLFYLWYRNSYVKEVGVAKFLIFSAVCIILSQALLFFRADFTAGSETPISMLAKFMYQQGVTLHTIFFTKYIDNYPVYLKMQSFIPGSVQLYSLFNPDEVIYGSSSALLSSSLNSSLFEAGYGVGWSIFSDLLLISDREPILIILFSMAFGGLIFVSDIKSKRNVFITSIGVILAYRIGFLPRAGLNGVFPLIIYSFILIIFFGLLKKASKK